MMKMLFLCCSAALALAGCGSEREPERAPDPEALEGFVAEVEAREAAERAAAVQEARAREDERKRESRERLDRYRTSAERVLSNEPAAEGAVKAAAR